MLCVQSGYQRVGAGSLDGGQIGSSGQLRGRAAGASCAQQQRRLEQRHARAPRARLLIAAAPPRKRHQRPQVLRSGVNMMGMALPSPRVMKS